MMAIPKSQCVALCVWRLVFEENIRTGIYRHSLWLLYTTLKGPDSCIASCPVCLGQKTAPGPTANSAADSQIASKFCACVKGNTSPCNQAECSDCLWMYTVHFYIKMLHSWPGQQGNTDVMFKGLSLIWTLPTVITTGHVSHGPPDYRVICLCGMGVVVPGNPT